MVENAAILIECFCIMLFITKYFSFKNENFKWLKCTLLFGLSYLIEIYALIFKLSEYVFVLLSASVVFMFSVCFLKGKNVEKLLLSIITYILFAFINLPVLSLFNSVLGCDMESITGGTSDERIEVLIITKLLYFLITQSIVVVNRKKEYVFCAAEWFMIIITSVIVISISFILHFIILSDNNPAVTVISLLLLIMEIIIFMIIQRISKANKKNTESQILSMQLRQLKHDNETAIKNYNSMINVQHDFKNYILNINTMVQTGKISEAVKYMDELLDRKINNLQTFVNTSSDVVNAVLNSKISAAEEKNISVRTSIFYTPDEKNELDVGNLIANLLDNAIEACSGQSEPAIELYMYSENRMKNIIVKNTVSGSVLLSNPELKTSKRTGLHGIGMRSVKDTVNELNGITDIYEQDGMFVVAIHYPE